MQYWTEGTFEQLKAAPPGKLVQQGAAAVAAAGVPAEAVAGGRADRAGSIRKRLLDEPRIAAGEKQLERMLVTLHDGRLRGARSARHP